MHLLVLFFCALALAVQNTLATTPTFTGSQSAPTPDAKAANTPVLTVTPDHLDGVYALDQPATWTVDVTSGDRSGLKAIPYVVKRDAADAIAQGTLDLSSGPAKITATRSEPGALLAEISVPTAIVTRPRRWYGGALFAPEKIGPAVHAPADFDAFWQAKLKELAAVPMNPVVEKCSIDDVKFNGGVPYYKVTLDNIWHTHVQGQLSRPAAGDKFPALLILQAAGVYPLQKEMVVRNAKMMGYLVLNIQAHDIPVDEPPEFYAKLKATTLKDYISFGIDNRDTCYFLRMILGCVRAAEYLTSRPDWDGKTLIVCGASQGGFQSFATAALFPKVSALVCNVPAGGDTSAVLAKPPRAVGWPACYFPPRPDDADGAKARATLSYFDTISFAARIHCPANVAVGLLDEPARPASVAAIYNAIPGTNKEFMIFPLFDHSASGAAPIWWARLDDWKNAAREGKPLPPATMPPATSLSTIIQASNPVPSPH